MHDSEEQRVEQASSAHEEEIARFLHDVSPSVIRAVLRNRSLSENDVLVIATRKNLPGDILETIAKDHRWVESYPVRLAIIKNPKTPLSISLSTARYIRLFDLAEISRGHLLPVVLRHKLEAIIVEKIPTMALGVKKTLAKIVSGNILLKLIQDGYPEVVKLCLDSPYLLESHLYKIINRPNTTFSTISLIARHSNWSSRYMTRLALVRNTHTPLSFAVHYLGSMRVTDLRDLYTDSSVPVTIKPFIHRELWGRGEQPVTNLKEKVYEIDEEDELIIEEYQDAQEHTDE